MGMIFLWVFNLKVSVCISNFPYTFLPFTYEEKKEICIAKILDKERRNERK